MGKLVIFSWWQLKLVARYQLLAIAFGIAAFYIAVILLFPVLKIPMISLSIIFMDPTGLGFIFVGVFILFEKGDHTLEAQVVTPMRTSNYLWSKALALLVPALICSLAIAFASRGLNYYILPFFISLTLSSLLFTFIGIAGVMRVDTFNQYMILIPLFMAPTFLPILNFYAISDWKFLAIIPTQSTLNLFESSFNQEFTWKNIADIVYLGCCTWLSYRVAKTEFEKKMYA